MTFIEGVTTTSFAFIIKQNEQQYCTSLFYNDMCVFFLVGLSRYGHSLQWEKPDIYSDQPVCSWHWYHGGYAEMGSAAYGQISTNTRWGETDCFTHVLPILLVCKKRLNKEEMYSWNEYYRHNLNISQKQNKEQNI